MSGGTGRYLRNESGRSEPQRLRIDHNPGGTHPLQLVGQGAAADCQFPRRLRPVVAVLPKGLEDGFTPHPPAAAGRRRAVIVRVIGRGGEDARREVLRQHDFTPGKQRRAFHGVGSSRARYRASGSAGGRPSPRRRSAILAREQPDEVRRQRQDVLRSLAQRRNVNLRDVGAGRKGSSREA